MLLFRSWRESLLLFLPGNFKLFFLVTLKSAIETYGLLFYYFWWLILLIIVFDVGCYYPECAIIGPIWLYVDISLYALFVFVLLMLARPSVDVKGFYYFKRHIRKTVLGYAFIWLFFITIRFGLARLWGDIFDYVKGNLPIGGTICDKGFIFIQFIYCQIPLVILPSFLFVVLFFFDSNGTILAWFYSIWRGIKMLIYNLPFCLISLVVLFAIWWGMMTVLPFVYGQYLFFSFVPFVVSYFKNLYVKRLHDQFELYFPKD